MLDSTFLDYIKILKLRIRQNIIDNKMPASTETLELMLQELDSIKDESI